MKREIERIRRRRSAAEWFLLPSFWTAAEGAHHNEFVWRMVQKDRNCCAGGPQQPCRKITGHMPVLMAFCCCPSATLSEYVNLFRIAWAALIGAKVHEYISFYYFVFISSTFIWSILFHLLDHFQYFIRATYLNPCFSWARLHHEG